MFQLTAFKEDTLTAYRRDILHSAAVMDGQLATITLLPIGVKVHDHRELSAVIVPKLISVTGIETSLFIKRIVEFVASDTGVAGAI